MGPSDVGQCLSVYPLEVRTQGAKHFGVPDRLNPAIFLIPFHVGRLRYSDPAIVKDERVPHVTFRNVPATAPGIADCAARFPDSVVRLLSESVRDSIDFVVNA